MGFMGSISLIQAGILGVPASMFEYEEDKSAKREEVAQVAQETILDIESPEIRNSSGSCARYMIPPCFAASVAVIGVVLWVVGDKQDDQSGGMMETAGKVMTVLGCVLTVPVTCMYAYAYFVRPEKD